MPEERMIQLNHIIILLILMINNNAHANNLPSSARSQKVIKQQTPLLQKDLSQADLELGAPIYIRIFKQEAQLEMWLKKDNEYELFKSYPICTFGFGGLGPKLQEGDGKAPEGFYFVKANQMNPYSSYHLSFNLGYPNAYDRAHQRTGSALMVHGNCVSVGCYAMTDQYINEIYTLAHKALEGGQNFFRVHVFPFRMTDENMKSHQSSQWYEFWQNLKQGYDFFEANQFNPPNVTVDNKRYIFN